MPTLFYRDTTAPGLFVLFLDRLFALFGFR